MISSHPYFTIPNRVFKISTWCLKRYKFFKIYSSIRRNTFFYFFNLTIEVCSLLIFIFISWAQMVKLCYFNNHIVTLFFYFGFRFPNFCRFFSNSSKVDIMRIIDTNAFPLKAFNIWDFRYRTEPNTTDKIRRSQRVYGPSHIRTLYAHDA